MDDDFDLDTMAGAALDGTVEVECSLCGYSAEVESDASHTCPKCRKGKLVSPLRRWALL